MKNNLIYLLLLVFISCNNSKQNINRLKKEYDFNVNNYSYNGIFNEVPYLYSTDFTDDDTVFIRVDENEFYFQQGRDKFILGRWLVLTDTLVLELKNLENMTYKYPLLILSQENSKIDEMKYFGQYTAGYYMEHFPHVTEQFLIDRTIGIDLIDTVYSVMVKQYPTPPTRRFLFV
ncbi:hypothetical protein [Flammeovirga aprica]|uniref:Uncharacterized protein n=1 Tax=Flammeovirga aprica JL-4 TaxID=694437 RepID=A0A7X9RYZ4_9BACT|nr:hypothetical protein [Flammeovirga aprica]NME71269.1 hypothetical protein [Flammeovirga aprica JL-4]